MSPVGVGLIGAGSIAEYHVNGLRAAGGAVVRAIAARSMHRARSAADRLGIGEATDDWRRLLDRSDIAALVVATPDDTHREIAVAAAGAGKAVLLQKPMAPGVADCQAILDAARQAGTVLEISFMHRHFEEVVAARELIASGTPGRVLSLQMRNATPGPDWAPWLYQRSRVGGGVVMQIGIHGIDLLAHLAGPVESVSATIATLRRSRTLRDGSVVVPDNEDAAHAAYRLSGGAVALHVMSFDDDGGTDRFRLEISCEHATLHLRGPAGKLSVHRSGAGWTTPALPDAAPGARHHAEFLSVVRGERASPGTAESGLAAVAVAQAVYHAAATGAWVTP